MEPCPLIGKAALYLLCGFFFIEHGAVIIGSYSHLYSLVELAFFMLGILVIACGIPMVVVGCERWAYLVLAVLLASSSGIAFFIFGGMQRHTGAGFFLGLAVFSISLFVACGIRIAIGVFGK